MHALHRPRSRTFRHLKFLYILSLNLFSKIAYVFVYYNLESGNLEWSNDVANISVEPITLIERGKRLNEADGEEEGWAIVRKFRWKMSWMRVTVELDRNIRLQHVDGNKSHHIVMYYRPQTPQTCEYSLFLRVLVHHRSRLISKRHGFHIGWRRNEIKIVLPSESASSILLNF